MVTMDWLAKLLELPEFFLTTGNGGGVIQVCTRFIHVTKALSTVARSPNSYKVYLCEY